MGCIISIIATVVTLNCPTPVSSGADAARLLAPRQYIPPAPRELRGPVIVLRETLPQAQAPRESKTGRAIHMGIPGGWTPLEWAILHSGGNK